MFTLPAIGLSSINAPELVIILLIVLVFFGAGKLPSVFKQLGSGVKASKDAQKDGAESGVDVTHVASTPKELSTDGVSDAQEINVSVSEARIKE